MQYIQPWGWCVSHAAMVLTDIPADVTDGLIVCSLVLTYQQLRGWCDCHAPTSRQCTAHACHAGAVSSRPQMAAVLWGCTVDPNPTLIALHRHEAVLEPGLTWGCSGTGTEEGACCRHAPSNTRCHVSTAYVISTLRQVLEMAQLN